jgi:hypothetical protein
LRAYGPRKAVPMIKPDIPEGAVVVWTDGGERAVWVDDDGFDPPNVCFTLDGENYDAQMEPSEARAFAEVLLKACEFAEAKKS